MVDADVVSLQPPLVDRVTQCLQHDVAVSRGDDLLAVLADSFGEHFQHIDLRLRMQADFWLFNH